MHEQPWASAYQSPGYEIAIFKNCFFCEGWVGGGGVEKGAVASSIIKLKNEL